MATLAELTTPLTRAEVEAQIYAAIAARGAKTTAWKPGSVVRTIIVGVAIVLAGLSRLQAEIAKMGFLELSEGDWLTLVAKYVYGVERDEGTFATGTVTLDNTAGGVYSGVAGDLRLLNSTTGKTYRNTEPYAIDAMETGVEVAIQAVEIGSDSSAAAGEIDDFESSPLSGVTVTNATAIVGTDREEDPALIVRCYERTGTLSPNGPADAYVFLAKSTKRADGSTISVTRARTKADGMGGVTIYVADADGDIPAPDLAIIQARLEAYAEPIGITATVVEATTVTAPVTYEIWLRTTGFTEADVDGQIKDALEAWFAVQPIGGHRKAGETVGKVYVEALQAIIAGVRGYETVDLDVDLPSGDITLAVDEVLVLGGVTPTIHFLPTIGVT